MYIKRSHIPKLVHVGKPPALQSSAAEMMLEDTLFHPDYLGRWYLCIPCCNILWGSVLDVDMYLKFITKMFVLTHHRQVYGIVSSPILTIHL